MDSQTSGPGRHIVIAADNLDALAALQPSTAGKVRAVLIDPPYNSGESGRAYVDTFDDWVGFMRPRLERAATLMDPNGSVLVALIGAQEVITLGALLREVFPGARHQMVTVVTNRAGVTRRSRLVGVAEYAHLVMVGGIAPAPGLDDLLEQVKADPARRVAVRWTGLRHRGSGWRRSDNPSGFYPLHLDPSTGRIVAVGDPLSPDAELSDAPVGPPGTVTVWPTNSAGEQGRWACSPATTRALLAQGFVRSRRKTRQRVGGWSVDYLSSGQRERIASGAWVVTGREPCGAVIISQQASLPVRRKDVWNHPRHATTHGSAMLAALLPGARFDHPKSVYLVADLLALFVGDDPDALVLDFFAGSGTTAHAVMLLNSVDGGRRGSISVTTNEVPARVARRLAAAGHSPGDPAWEAYGIARAVLHPRLVAAASGSRPDGSPVLGRYRWLVERDLSQGFVDEVVVQELHELGTVSSV